MKFCYEQSLKEFEFWGKAAQNAATLRDWEWEVLEKKLEGMRKYWNIENIDVQFSYEIGLNEIAQWLGYKSWKQRLECCLPKWAPFPEWETFEEEEEEEG